MVHETRHRRHWTAETLTHLSSYISSAVAIAGAQQDAVVTLLGDDERAVVLAEGFATRRGMVNTPFLPRLPVSLYGHSVGNESSRM